MTRICFYLDTRTIRSVDVRDVDAGNPGMGGTEYLFFLVAAHLARTHEVAMYVTHDGAFPEGMTYHVVPGFPEAAAAMARNREEMLVLRESEIWPNRRHLDRMSQPVLVWAHNYSNHRTLRACAQCPKVARYLCVSREQYENLRDEAVFQKADYVYNAAVTRNWPLDPPGAAADNVFYMGSLIQAKGFHVLAKYWKDIVRAVPTARLHVVGSGRLYDRDAPLGPLGIASPEYERWLAPHVTEGGKVRDDIIFHGALGAEKIGVLGQAKVAVVNPTGVGETFCLSAMEFGLMGVPVVTRNVGGPVNVVRNGVTGILYDRESDLPRAVIGLLKDEAGRRAMGQSAIAHIRAQFDIDVVIARWETIIREVQAGLAATPDYAVTGGPKGLKEWNRKLKRIPFLRWLPSIDYWTHAARKRFHSLFLKPIRNLRSR